MQRASEVETKLMEAADRSSEQLLAEIQQLRSQLARKDDTIRTLQAQETACIRLFEYVPQQLFRVFRNEGGLLSFASLSSSDNQDSASVIPESISIERLKEYAQTVFKAGKPVEYYETSGRSESDQSWHVMVVPSLDSSGKVRSLLCAARNITDERRTQRALLETETLYQRLIELLPDAVILTSQDGVVQYANSAALNLVGASEPDQLIGQYVWDSLLDEDLQYVRKQGQRLRKGERMNLAEQRLIRLDGKTLTVETASAPVRYHNHPSVLTTARNISERKRIEEALAESRELFFKAFQLGPAASSIYRLGDRVLLDVNQQFCELAGFERDRLVGASITELQMWLNPSVHETIIDEVQKQGFVHNIETQLRRSTGEIRSVLVSAHHIEVRGEACLLAVTTDVTKQKQVEEELVLAKEQAEEMARVKSAFLTNMTHEVRTPLTVVLGFTSMLRQGVRPEYRRFVRVIERSSRRLLLMLDSILDLAQLEAGTLEIDREPFNLIDVARNVGETAKTLAEEKGLAFVMRLPTERIYIPLGHRIVGRVLNNLLDNAIKFTDLGSIELSIQTEADQVFVNIEDTGVGIDDVFLPHVFDEFSQESTGLERTHQGSGLGLTVSRRLIEMVGGAIQVASRKGKGSIFTVALPKTVAVKPAG